MSRNNISLAACYLFYNLEKEGDNFEKFQRCLSSIPIQDKTFIIVDNANEGSEPQKLDRNIYKIGGDNTFREFSGWQRGINAIQELKIPADVILLANSRFLFPRGSLLKYYNASSLLKQAFENNVIIGRIGRCRKRITVYDYDVSEWIGTNCFFIPRRALELIPDIIPVKENISDFFDKEYSPHHLILDRELSASDFKQGDFLVEAALDGDGPKEIRIVIDRVEQAAKLTGGQPIILRIEKLFQTDKGSERVELVRGWRYDRQGNKWITRTKMLASQAHGGKILRLEGHIPPAVLEKTYHSRLRLQIFDDGALFKDQAPLNRNFRLHLVEWLTGRWHSRFEINPQTWDFFKNKVATILNEVLLSVRFIEAGYRIRPFGNLDQALLIVSKFVKI